MTIHILPPSGLTFPDATGVTRKIRGIPLTARDEFRSHHEAALNLFLTAEEDLWAHRRFRDRIRAMLEIARAPEAWLVHGETNLTPRLLLSYSNNGGIFQGDLISWEYPAPRQGESSKVKTAELQAFSSLLLEDLAGELHEIFPLCAKGYYRFVDLLTLANDLMSTGFHQAYDTDPIFRRFIHEALDLFGLRPEQVSAALTTELLFFDWVESGSGRLYYPGWLQQLCSPPVDYKQTLEPLPQGEHPYHQLIAALWGDDGLEGAIASANAVPYPVLRSILHSRHRMLSPDSKKSSTSSSPKINSGHLTASEREFVDSIDYDELQREFMKSLKTNGIPG